MHDGPMNTRFKLIDWGTKNRRIFFQNLVEVLTGKRIRDFLCLFKAVDFIKGIFSLLIADTFSAELICEPIVGIAIKLSPKRCPGRYAEITKAIVLIDEIEIVMEAPPGIVFEKSLV